MTRTNAAFAAVDTLPKPIVKDGLDPRATRYGIFPIWPQNNVHAKDFALWILPANQVIPFRAFSAEPIMGSDGQIADEVPDRTPEAQIIDCFTMSPNFLELTELAKLNDENKAQAVMGPLTNPKSCDKYSRELGQECVTCWLNYLLFDADDAIAEAFVEGSKLLEVAYRTKDELVAGFDKALAKARTDVDELLREIDNPQKPKSAPNEEHDMRTIRHVHGDRPRLRSIASNDDAVERLAQAISQGRKQEDPITADAIAKIVSDTVAPLLEKNAELEQRLAKYETETQAAPPENKTKEKIKQ
jgi:hypothetical protein